MSRRERERCWGSDCDRAALDRVRPEPEGWPGRASLPLRPREVDSVDRRLVGFWRVLSFEMIEDVAVRLIPFEVGEPVEFTATGKYTMWADPRRPATCLCRAFRRRGVSALDVWIKGLERLCTHCIYEVDEARLRICIAGDSRPRPAEIKQDDERLWCVLTFERCDPPPKVRPAKPRKLLEPGRYIPKGLFGKPRAKRRK